MPTLEEIKKQIELSGNTGKSLDKLLESREVKELPSVLSQDERIEQIIKCTFNQNIGILVATNKRLVFLFKGIFSGLTVEDFASYNKFSSVSYKTGFLLGDIEIRRTEIPYFYFFGDIDKDKTSIFGEFLRSKIPKESNPIDNETNQDDVVSKLERLANLKTQGILTEEEFLEQKKKILNG